MEILKTIDPEDLKFMRSVSVDTPYRDAPLRCQGQRCRAIFASYKNIPFLLALETVFTSVNFNLPLDRSLRGETAISGIQVL